MFFLGDNGCQVACELNGITLDRKGRCWSLQTLTSKCQPETVPVEVGIPGENGEGTKTLANFAVSFPCGYFFGWVVKFYWVSVECRLIRLMKLYEVIQETSIRFYEIL